jgi:hypothetical protein
MPSGCFLITKKRCDKTAFNQAPYMVSLRADIGICLRKTRNDLVASNLLHLPSKGDGFMARPVECTLADLLEQVNRVTEDDQAVVAAVTLLINSGQVRLQGKFAGAKVSLSPSLSPFPKFLWPSLLGLPALQPHAGRAGQGVRPTA